MISVFSVLSVVKSDRSACVHQQAFCQTGMFACPVKIKVRSCNRSNVRAERPRTLAADSRRKKKTAVEVDRINAPDLLAPSWPRGKRCPAARFEALISADLNRR
jgi:hypothetical protein